MTTFIDCHCHLTSERFEHDLDAVLARAYAKGLCGILTCSTSHADILRVIRLRQERPDLVYPCLGLHPLSGGFDEEGWSETRSLIVSEHLERGLAGIGEIGLDFTRPILNEQARARGTSEVEVRASQVAAFEAQVALALDLGLPVNVHSRNAERETLDILKRTGVQGVMHAYMNNASLAVEAAKSGRLLFSFPPSLVYKWEYQEAVKALPLDVLLLETDSPALGADGPKKRNEPGFIYIAAQKMAELKAVSVQEIAEVTTRNAERLFGSVVPDLFAVVTSRKRATTSEAPITKRWSRRKPLTLDPTLCSDAYGSSRC